MGTEANHPHILFFPYMEAGHMLPMVDMAKLFSRAARVTILTTPVNDAIIRSTIGDFSVHLHTIPFPSDAFGLLNGSDNLSSIVSESQRINFFKAANSLRQPFDYVLTDLRPDCVVTDVFLPWTYHIAAARGIPRIVFEITSNFALCATRAFARCRHILVDKFESFVLPDLPHRIEMLITEIMDLEDFVGTSFESLKETLEEAAEVESKSYGVVMNSFYELEPDYADRYRKMIKRVWNIGPVSLCNREVADQSSRGGQPPASDKDCLKWLDKKPTGSVVYMCFGSGGFFSMAQVREMAQGMEASGHPFIWVVRNEGDDWIPAGYEERIRERGMVIRGWAPQLLILNHGAVGGFVTHCGWNSSLEGICAGLPMVTWPLYAEQFYNEKFLVEVLKIGVAVGSKVFSFDAEERSVVEAAAVEEAVRRVMGEGEEEAERRRKAKELGEMARGAVEKGGSSSLEMEKLMQELMDLKKKHG